MFLNIPIDLKITPRTKLKSPQKEKILSGIESFLNNFPIIIQEYEKRTLHLARLAAPSRTGGLSAGLDTVNYNGEGFALTSNPDNTYGEDEKIDGWSVGSKTRGIMMEFGYPYNNYWGPYLPNPRPGNVSSGSKKGLEQFYGLGYMRISYIVAARSLYQQKVSYSTNGLSLSDVKSYVKRSEEEFTGSLRKLLLKYLRNEGLPPYLRRKSIPKTASPVKLASNTAFGDVANLKLNIPIQIEGEAGYNALRTGNNLRGATQSLNRGAPFVSGFEFATDDSSGLNFLPF